MRLAPAKNGVLRGNRTNGLAITAVIKRSSSQNDVFEVYAEKINRETFEWINSL